MRPISPIPCIVLVGGLLLRAVCNAAPTPTLPPVRAGLWHVTSTMHFEPDPEPGSRHWPGLDKPREQAYEICLTTWRAAHPMTPPQTGRVVRVGDDTLALTETSVDAVGSPGRAEWRYRRASDVAFDGAQRLALGDISMNLEYRGAFCRR